MSAPARPPRRGLAGLFAAKSLGINRNIIVGGGANRWWDVILLVAGEIRGTWDSDRFLSDPLVRELFLGSAKAKATDPDHVGITDDASAA